MNEFENDCFDDEHLDDCIADRSRQTGILEWFGFVLMFATALVGGLFIADFISEKYIESEPLNRTFYGVHVPGDLLRGMSHGEPTVVPGSSDIDVESLAD